LLSLYRHSARSFYFHPRSVLSKRICRARVAFSPPTERAWKGYLEILERIAQPDHAGIPESYYEVARLSVINAVGILEASKGLATALDRVEQLDFYPLFQVNAWRIRLIYYLRQGQMQKAEECQRRLELLQIQNSPAQFFEGSHLFPVLLAYCLTDDLTGVGQTIYGITKMAEQFSTWQPVLHFARGEYERIRGDYASALGELQKVIANIGRVNISFGLTPQELILKHYLSSTVCRKQTPWDGNI